MNNLRKVVHDYLKENGFDGLCYDDECSCTVDDLAPCHGNPFFCELGYKIPTPEDNDLYGVTQWSITTEKPGTSDNR